MIEFAVRDVSKIQWYEYGIYLFRHNLTGRVLYVGCSHWPKQRICQHRWGTPKSRFSQFLRENMPDALDWLVEIYRADECDWLVQTYSPRAYASFKSTLDDLEHGNLSAFTAEAAMIEHCKPPYNYIRRYANGKRTA